MPPPAWPNAWRQPVTSAWTSVIAGPRCRAGATLPATIHRSSPSSWASKPRYTTVSAWSARIPTALACGSSRSPSCSARAFATGRRSVWRRPAAPWFDRDLSLAGRVTYRRDGKVESQLIDFKLPIAIIPNLAIHLNRTANEGWAINPQNELPPILAQVAGDERIDFRALLTEQLAREHELIADVVLDYELSFDTQQAALVGLNGDFIAAARLDNLLSCYAGLQALLAADSDETCVLVCTDHEEVGSCSACGADGPMLEQTLQRLLPDGDTYVRTLQRSLMVSADNAHGVHPNYADKHDGNHGPNSTPGQ